MITEVATAIPMDARGSGDPAAASVRRAGSGRENMAESSEEVHDSRVEVSIQWIKETFCPLVCVSHVMYVGEIGSEDQRCSTFPQTPNTFFLP